MDFGTTKIEKFSVLKLMRMKKQLSAEKDNLIITLTNQTDLNITCNVAVRSELPPLVCTVANGFVYLTYNRATRC